MKKARFIILICMFIMLSFATPVRATSITWSIQNVVFDLVGGSMTGSFTYDTATDSITDWYFATGPSGTFGGYAWSSGQAGHSIFHETDTLSFLDNQNTNNKLEIRASFPFFFLPSDLGTTGVIDVRVRELDLGTPQQQRSDTFGPTLVGTQPIPEPSTLLLLGSGLAGLGYVRRRFKG
jgi:hypothetical protein